MQIIKYDLENWIINFRTGVGVAPTMWILTTGFWNDAVEWIDGETWDDGIEVCQK